MRCSFCQKNKDEVAKLFAGPQAFICNECIEVCVAIIAKEHEVEPPMQDLSIPWSPVILKCALCRIPVSADEALGLGDRGIICLVCANEVQAAHAERQLR